MGDLNLHSILYGNDVHNPAGRIVRGQRLFCSNRDKREGCGRTTPVFLSHIIPGYTISASILWPVLAALLQAMGSGSIAACAESVPWPFSLEALYHLLRALRRRLDRLRTGLFSIGPPPLVSSLSDPLLHAVEHLRALFPGEPCPLSAFSLLKQRCWLL